MTLQVTGKARHVKNIFTGMAAIADEATITVTPEGITVRGMDPQHIVLLDIHYPNHAFEKFECDGATKMGIRLADIKTILKRAQKDDENVKISLDDDSMIVFAFGDKIFKNRLVESSASDTPLPKLSLPASIETSYKNFKDLLDDVAFGKDTEYEKRALRIEAQGNRVRFSRTSDTTDYESTKATGDEWKVQGEGKATYTVDYLTSIMDAVKAEKIRLQLGDTMPLLMTFDEGHIHFYVAPRVKD
jgi:proliferating cell nuclear antigen